MVVWNYIELYSAKPFKADTLKDLYAEVSAYKTTKGKAVGFFEFKVATDGTVALLSYENLNPTKAGRPKIEKVEN